MSRSPKGVVAAGHELTARTAEQILGSGGNAFDAALGALCTACVAEPVLASLGGGGFLLARTADGRSRVYDFFVHTPRARRDASQVDFRPVVLDFGTAQQTFHIGLGSTATPGVVRGLFAVHRDLGRMPLKELVAPAVEQARAGVALNEFQAYVLRIVEPIYTASPRALATFGQPDTVRVMGAGEVIRQPELADLLEVLAIEGQDLFYRGEVARAIADECAAGGGHLTRDDLKRYAIALREPLAVDYRGARVLTNPPPASGGALIAFALQLLASVGDLRRHTFGSYVHLGVLVRVMELTNKSRVDVLARAANPPRGESWLDPELLDTYRREVLDRAAALRGTTHIDVIDWAGNVASLSVSNGEGCGHVVSGTGIMPNNMLGEQDLNPQGLGRWPADQRMTSMMAPSLVQFPGGRLVATGSGGSNRIRTAILQVLVNLVDYEMSVERAVSSPRVFWERGRLSLERGLPERELQRLLRDYPQHEVWDELNLYFGGAHTVERGTGFSGCGDPRRGGVCLVAS